MKEIKKFGEWLTEQAIDNKFVLNEEYDVKNDPNCLNWH